MPPNERQKMTKEIISHWIAPEHREQIACNGRMANRFAVRETSAVTCLRCKKCIANRQAREAKAANTTASSS